MEEYEVEAINGEIRVAGLSTDLKHRYYLGRIWDKTTRAIVFVGLNPSTATHEVDDPTIRRCRNFAKQWGYGGFIMLNLFSFRATSPKDMKAQHGSANGPLNDRTLKEYQGWDIVFCWGTHGAFMNRGKEVADMFPNAKCLGKTAEGHPKHPLYLKSDTKLIDYHVNA